jgi:hypothetical protein
VKRILAVIVALLVGPIGLIFATGAFGCLSMVVKGLWTGVLEREDYLGATGDVRIVRITDPDWYWENIEFYTFVFVVLGLIATAIIWSLLKLLRYSFRKRCSG